MQATPPYFKILALGPFDGNPSRAWEQPPIAVDLSGMDEVIDAIDVRLWLPLDASLCPQGGLTFRFNRFKEWHPDGIIAAQPYLTRVDKANSFMLQAYHDGLSADRIREGLHQWPDLPAVDIRERPAARSTASTPTAADDTIDNLLNMVAVPDSKPSSAPTGRGADASPLAHVVPRIMEILFDDPQFRRLEAAWRGLRLLLQQGAVEDNVKVDTASVYPETLEASLEFLSAHLIDDLPNLVLLDLGFDNTPVAMERLSTAAQWAGSLMVPLIAWVPSRFWGIDRWEDLSTLPFLPHHLEAPEYAKFQNLRNGPDGHWICLTCNGFLARFAYGPENRPRKVVFDESRPPWVSPAWALGSLIAQAVSRTGRPARFSDPQHFRLQDLALHSDKGPKPIAVETLLPADRRDQMIRAGITPMTADRDTGFIPQAVTLSGGSLAFQLLTSQVTQFILWCKDNLPAETDPTALALQLRLAFQVFNEQSSPQGFESYDIQADSPKPDGRIPVRISVIPSPVFLPSRTPIEMYMDW